MSPDPLLRLREALGDRYLVEREIGRGGWSTVYLAHDAKHDRRVAVKVSRPELAASLGARRFLQEIRVVARFQHPHILPLYDSGATAESLYYVMPYIEGESLRARLQREAELPIEEALQIARDVADALAYAHRHGVVHRDIKPENILLSGGHAVVTDFGIAHALGVAASDEPAGTPAGTPAPQEAPGAERRRSGGDRLTRSGITVGTPAYMSPEQALGDATLDARSDIYSLAVVLYEMLTGAPPFGDLSIQSVIDRQLDEHLIPLISLRPDVPEQVSEAVAVALAVPAYKRFASAEEFAAAITPPPERSGSTWPPSRAARRHRRRRRFAGTGVALAAAAAGVWLWRSRAPEVTTSPTSVAVFPFSVRGSREVDYLGSGMVDLLGTDLDGAGALRGVDAHAVIGSLAGESAPSLTPERGGAVARRLGAGLFVLGSILESDGRLRIHASMFDVRRAGAPIAQATAEGSTSRIFDLVDEIAAELIADRSGGPETRLSRLAAVTTRSLPALKAYLEGEAHLRAGRADSAMAAFGRATTSDSTFALAFYQRAVAAGWAADFAAARASSDQAVRFGDRLAADDRRLLQALVAYNRGSAAEAEVLYRGILREQPENVEAWYQLGEVLFHYGALRGRSMTEARGAFERALFLDPENADALLHLADIAARERRLAVLDSLLARVRQVGAEPSIVLRRRALRAFAAGDEAERARVLSELRRESDGTVIVCAGWVAGFLHDFAGAERIARLLLEPTRSGEARAFGHAQLAQLALARGRWRAAQAELEAAVPLDPARALEERAILQSLPFVPARRVELDSTRAALEAWNAAAVPPSSSASAVLRVHDGVHPAMRLYLLGLVSARAGDFASASRRASELRALIGAEPAPRFPRGLALGLEADSAARVGRPLASLKALESIGAAAPLDLVANSSFFAHARERYLRAEELRRVGRGKEALAWYGTLAEGRADFLYAAPAAYGEATVYESLGERRSAAAAYARAAALWERADPELLWLVTAARAGLARVGAASGR